jgi:hypothetical protein
MHPNTNGHFVLASYFRDALVQRGWKLEEITPPNQREFRRVQLISWMLKNGLPWFFKRSFDLLPAAILLMAMELCRIALGRIGKVIRAI